MLYNDLSSVQQHLSDSTLSVLLKRLAQDGCRVVCLEGTCFVFVLAAYRMFGSKVTATSSLVWRGSLSLAVLFDVDPQVQSAS